MMNSSRVVLLVLFSCSVSSCYREVVTNISLIGSWKPVCDDSLFESVLVSHQSSPNQTCFPKSWNMFIHQRMIIALNNKCTLAGILVCYCLTSDSKSSDMNTSSMHSGKYFYGCFTKNVSTHYMVQLVEQNDKDKCAQYNRNGILCGQCMDGYAPAAYSFSLK